MRRFCGVSVATILLCHGAILAHAGQQKTADSAAGGRQTETDEYTRYELLTPESASFRIRYEVTATTGGAKFFFNPIRKGSTASDEAAYDARTGKPLQFGV